MTGGSSLRLRLTRLFLLAGLLAAVFLTATVVSLVQLARATHARVDVYGPALLATQSLATSFSDQQTGVRGFVSSGDENFLVPYVKGRADARASERRLEALLTERPDLRRRLAQVRVAGRAWRETYAVAAIARTREAGASPLPPTTVQEGQARFDEIRGAIARLQAPVRHQRDDAGAVLRASQRRLDVILSVAFAGLLALAAVTFWALRRWVTARSPAWAGRSSRSSSAT